MAYSVLRGLPACSITRAILMDHLDWFDPDGVDSVEEIALLHRALAPGGFVLLRSASRKPWYIESCVSCLLFDCLLHVLRWVY